MKILYYTDQIYKHGGLERVLSNKLNYLSNNTTLELYVVTIAQNSNPPCYQINEDVKLIDLDINYNRDISFISLKNIKYIREHYRKLKKTVQKIQPDVIVVCNYDYAFYFVPFIAKKALKIKEFHSSRYFSNKVREENKSLIRKLMFGVSDFFQKKYDNLVLLTKDEFQYYYTNNKVCIENACSITNSQTLAPLENKRVISAGRIAPVKGFEDLINAWSHVNENYPDWQLDIYGDGDDIDYLKSLKDLVKELNLESSIKFMGSTSNLDKEMLSASIYAMSSKTECFPMVLLEAMSLGVPIVSYDCPNGPRHIITNEKDGFLVPNGNIIELSKKINYLIENKDLRLLMGTLGHQNVQRFSEKLIMNKWLNLFNKK